jgi:hypothetical protein
MWTTTVAEARSGHPGLWRFSLVCLVCAAFTGLASVVDGRLVNGAPVWHKPLKFFASAAIYTATFSWYLAQLPQRGAGSRRFASGLGTAIWVLLGGELALIAMQAARGTGSHFNIASPFDATVFAVMGIMIALLSVVHALLWVSLLRASIPDGVRLSACRWGAGLTLGGLLIGTLMLGPRPDQLAILRAGGRAPSGAHAVGVPDGGAGLPFVNWSLEGGDHRVGHFVGLHAMQALPLVLLLLPNSLPAATRLMAVRATGIAYGLLTLLLVQQATAARPLLYPGPRFGMALLVVLVAWVVAIARARRVLQS